MNQARLFRTLWCLAGLALLLGLAREPLQKLVPAPRELPRLDGRTGLPWINEGFAPQEIAPGLLPPRIQHASSWVGTDEWEGRAETAWFRATRSIIHVAVSGHPGHPQCRLWAEFKHADNRITRVDCRIPDPGLEWNIWEIRRPSSATAVRIVAEDRARTLMGWVAFSHPFRAWPGWVFAAYQFFQVITTTALVLTLIWGPGVLLSPRGKNPESRAALLLGAGPLILAGIGILVWVLGAWLPVRPIATTLITGLWLALGRLARARDFVLLSNRALSTALGVSALLVICVVARSFFSLGPPGELYRGMVSRNFELSDRIDSRFSFYIVQAAAHHWRPIAPQTEKFFYPWTFFSRGPIAGLAAVPVVLATQAQPPDVMPENRWSPFDRTGFAAYRITMITLASGIVVAFFLVLLPFVGERIALAGAGLLALSPFGIHEILFTWPKWAATAWVLLSFTLAHARRPLAAGLALGLGFYLHPLALLWAPWIGLWAGGRAYQVASDRRTSALLSAGVRCALGACVFALPWMALGALMPHDPKTPFAGQAGFLEYWTRADWRHATWDTWWQTRWMNFANTFIPLHLVVHEQSLNHPKLGSAYETSTQVVKFSQVWWNTLPFALGLGLWVACLAALNRARRILRPAFWLLVVAPALFIVAYWGMDPLGLMRECGHPLFVALIGIAVVLAARQRGILHTLLLHRATPWLQVPETSLMLWLTTWFNNAPRSVEHAHLDWLYLGLHGLSLLAIAGTLSRARTQFPDTALPAVPTRSAPCDQHRIAARLPTTGWIVLGFAGLALVIGPFRASPEECRPIPGLNGGWDANQGTFVAQGVYTFTRMEELPANIPSLGSWNGDDRFVGDQTTGWFEPSPRFSILVSGYPLKPGNRLELETLMRDGTGVRIPYDGRDVGERWRRWEPKLGPDVARFRIHATDAHTEHGGWLAFSAPFTSHPRFGAQAWSLLQIGATTCLALTLLIGPGLIWYTGRPRELSSLAFAVLPGPLLLAGLGVVCWALGGVTAPAILARTGVILLLAYLAWSFWRSRKGEPLPGAARTLIGAITLLVGFAVAKANVSFGPAGELFQGLVSRTLAVGGHSDSQISFHTVQVVAHHLSPSAEQTQRYFEPWRFSSRGPLAGLMAAPIVLATGARVPIHHPNQPWRPYDIQGFAVYRIACMTLAALSALAVFGAVTALTNPAWGMFGAITALLAPFFVHEVYFTWPKLIAGALVIVSFLAAYQRRPFFSGVMVALGYLFHPLASLSAPFLGLWVLAQSADGGWRGRMVRGAAFAAGALLLVIPWQIFGWLQANGQVGQKVFLTYFMIADNAPATWSTWWQSRWDNFANTFLPGYLLGFDSAHESINSFYERSDAWVRSSFLWWNTLPFALGAPGFVFVAVAVTRATRRAFLTTALFLFAPAGLLIVYWGAASSGLMRQCGHALFFSAMVFAVGSAAKLNGASIQRLTAALLHPACFLWRGTEVALMAFGTTLLNQRPNFDSVYGANDAVSVLVAASCLAGLVILLANVGRSLRSSLFTITTPA